MRELQARWSVALCMVLTLFLPRAKSSVAFEVESPIQHQQSGNLDSTGLDAEDELTPLGFVQMDASGNRGVIKLHGGFTVRSWLLSKRFASSVY